MALERNVQRDVKAVYEACGCNVANFSQGYRPGGRRHGTTRQTKGIPDLYVFPPLGHYQRTPFWHETKRAGGKQSLEQRAWQLACMTRGVDYVLGGVNEAIAHLRHIGLLREVPPISMARLMSHC